MPSDTQTISIDAAPEHVVAFVGDPANLPRWAVGFAQFLTPGRFGLLADDPGGGPVSRERG
jgi:hypothetical protein